MASGRICWRRRCWPSAGWMTGSGGLILSDGIWNCMKWNLCWCFLEGGTRWDLRWILLSISSHDQRAPPRCLNRIPWWKSPSPVGTWTCELCSVGKACEADVKSSFMKIWQHHKHSHEYKSIVMNATGCHCSQHPLTFFVQDVEGFLGQRFFFSGTTVLIPMLLERHMPNMVASSKALSSLIPAASDYPQQKQLPLIHSKDCCSLLCGVRVKSERRICFLFFSKFMILVKGEEKVGSPLSIPLFLIHNGSFCTSQCGCMISSIKSMQYEWDFDLIGNWYLVGVLNRSLFFEMESRSFYLFEFVDPHLNPRQAHMKL